LHFALVTVRRLTESLDAAAQLLDDTLLTLTLVDHVTLVSDANALSMETVAAPLTRLGTETGHLQGHRLTDTQDTD